MPARPAVAGAAAAVGTASFLPVMKVRQGHPGKGPVDRLLDVLDERLFLLVH